MRNIFHKMDLIIINNNILLNRLSWTTVTYACEVCMLIIIIIIIHAPSDRNILENFDDISSHCNNRGRDLYAILIKMNFHIIFGLRKLSRVSPIYFFLILIKELIRTKDFLSHVMRKFFYHFKTIIKLNRNRKLIFTILR